MRSEINTMSAIMYPHNECTDDKSCHEDEHQVPDLHDEQLTTDSPILNSLVSAANTVNKLFSRSSCARVMCQLYTEKQLEFEIRQDRLSQQSVDVSNNSAAVGGLVLTSSEDSCCSSTASPIDRAYMKCAPPADPVAAFEVELYRRFLFDEESVVDTLRHRGDEDD